MDVQWLSSDALLILLLLLVLSLCALKLPFLSLDSVLAAPRGPWSPHAAFASFSSYHALADNELRRMRAAYARLSLADKRVGFALDYPRKLDRLRDATAANARVARAISALAAPDVKRETHGDVPRDLGKVREVMKHFVRDWSAEGRPERGTIFAPILDVLSETAPESRQEMKVLVPGAGLGRLAWEISQLGFCTTANELSPYMTFALHFLLSASTTSETNQHVVHPYAHWWSHQRASDATFRSISFPDVIPRLSHRFVLEEGDFLKLSMPKGEGYEFIVTLFFIDTSLNAIATLRKIYALLKPGGTWINLGPLLWVGGGQASVELSLEEVLHLAREIGFTFESTPPSGASAASRAQRTVECEYTGDPRAMMRWIYRAEFWVATRKPERGAGTVT